MADYYYREVDANDAIASVGLLGDPEFVDKDSEVMVLNRLSDLHTWIDSSGSTEILDVEGLENKGSKISRMPECVKTQEKTAIMTKPGAWIIGIWPEQVYDYSEIKDSVFNAIIDALSNQGVNVVYDKESSQGNDLVVNGKKFCGCAAVREGERTGIGLFISFDAPYDLLKYYRPGEGKFEGKSIEGPEERVIGLNELDVEIDREKLIKDIRSGLEEQLFSEPLEEKEFPYRKEAEREAEKLRLD